MGFAACMTDPPIGLLIKPNTSPTIRSFLATLVSTIQLYPAAQSLSPEWAQIVRDRFIRRNVVKKISIVMAAIVIMFAVLGTGASAARAMRAFSGGSGGGGTGGTAGVDTIKVSKSYYVASNGTILVNASSSDATAHLYVYLPSGMYVGEVRNGGGGRYGGAVFYVGNDPVTLTIKSSSGGSITVHTVPFQA
jgi:hypothetical protein